MRDIEAANAADYLYETGRAPPGSVRDVTELTGGVSNIVLRVDFVVGPPLVLKQCRERLRVAQEWRAPLRRIWTECEALRVLADVLPAGTVPRILFEDRPNYLFAMECAPEGMVTWKSRLMARQIDPAVAERVGRTLAQIHTRAASHPALDGILADSSLFEELRTDPYYRRVAVVHPVFAPALDGLIESMSAVPSPSLVLGDYSPKNILVNTHKFLLLDFECAHRGDSSFDLGFCLSHLVLKTFLLRDARMAECVQRFALGYGLSPANRDFVERVGLHTAACMLARLDGKSPVEYVDRLDQSRVQAAARALLLREQMWTSVGDLAAWLARVTAAE